MEEAALGQVPRDRHLARGHLPLRLGRKPRAREARVGVRLVPADVADGILRPQRLGACEGLHPPGAVAAQPVERRVDRARLRPREAVRRPVRRVAVGAGLDELQPLRVRDRPARQLEGREEDAVRRALVVEREARTRVADLAQSLRVADPRERRGRALGRAARPRDRPAAAGSAPAVCFTSVRISSWCCCSWWSPSVVTSQTRASRSGSFSSSASMQRSTCAR